MFTAAYVVHTGEVRPRRVARALLVKASNAPRSARLAAVASLRQVEAIGAGRYLAVRLGSAGERRAVGSVVDRLARIARVRCAAVDGCEVAADALTC